MDHPASISHQPTIKTKTKHKNIGVHCLPKAKRHSQHFFFRKNSLLVNRKGSRKSSHWRNQNVWIKQRPNLQQETKNTHLCIMRLWVKTATCGRRSMGMGKPWSVVLLEMPRTTADDLFWMFYKHQSQHPVKSISAAQSRLRSRL